MKPNSIYVFEYRGRMWEGIFQGSFGNYLRFSPLPFPRSAVSREFPNIIPKWEAKHATFIAEMTVSFTENDYLQLWQNQTHEIPD